jgi:hypothetical protein
MPGMICPSCGGLLSSPDESCPRCGTGRANLEEQISAQSSRSAVLIAGGTMAAGAVLLIGGPAGLWLWGQQGGDATWGWLGAVLCAAGGLAALARGAHALMTGFSWRRRG